MGIWRDFGVRILMWWCLIMHRDVGGQGWRITPPPPLLSPIERNGSALA